MKVRPRKTWERQSVRAQLVELALLEAASLTRSLNREESERLGLLIGLQQKRERADGEAPIPTIDEAMAALRSRRSRVKSAEWRAQAELSAINLDLDRLRRAAGMPLKARWGEGEVITAEAIRLRQMRSERELTVEEAERLGVLMAVLLKRSSKANRARIELLLAEVALIEDIEISRAGRADYTAPTLELVQGGNGWALPSEQAA